MVTCQGWACAGYAHPQRPATTRPRPPAAAPRRRPRTPACPCPPPPPSRDSPPGASRRLHRSPQPPASSCAAARPPARRSVRRRGLRRAAPSNGGAIVSAVENDPGSRGNVVPPANGDGVASPPAIAGAPPNSPYGLSSLIVAGYILALVL